MKLPQYQLSEYLKNKFYITARFYTVTTHNSMEVSGIAPDKRSYLGLMNLICHNLGKVFPSSFTFKLDILLEHVKLSNY